MKTYLALIACLFLFGCSESSDQVHGVDVAQKLANGDIFLFASYDTLHVLDVTDPEAPEELSFIVFESVIPELITYKSFAYCFVLHNGAWAIDLSDPRNPVVTGQFASFGHTDQGMHNFQIIGKRLLATVWFSDDSAWQARQYLWYDLTNPTLPVEDGIYRFYRQP